MTPNVDRTDGREDVSVRRYVRDALAATDSTSHDLWIDYVALTGNASSDAVLLFIDDDGSLPAREVDRLEQAAFERLHDSGLPTLATQ